MRRTVERFLRDGSGATAIEYSLVAGLMSLVVIAALTAIGSKVNADFRNVSSGLT
jgi:pilus assembly protein Flp/PilA